MSQQQAAPPSTSEPAAAAAATLAPPPTAQSSGGGQASGCPPHVLEAIYGKQSKVEKKEALDKSLQRWWTEYADRKNDETDEYVANSLLYDRRHLPRTAPAPDCVRAAAAQQQQQAAKQQQPAEQQQAPGAQ